MRTYFARRSCLGNILASCFNRGFLLRDRKNIFSPREPYFLKIHSFFVKTNESPTTYSAFVVGRESLHFFLAAILDHGSLLRPRSLLRQILTYQGPVEAERRRKGAEGSGGWNLGEIKAWNQRPLLANLHNRQFTFAIEAKHAIGPKFGHIYDYLAHFNSGNTFKYLIALSAKLKLKSRTARNLNIKRGAYRDIEIKIPVRAKLELKSRWARNARVFSAI